MWNNCPSRPKRKPPRTPPTGADCRPWCHRRPRTLRPAFEGKAPLHAWASVRCTSADRLPIVGPADAQALPGLWLNTAMGARGLTRAVLCGELLAARLQGEPLPLDAKLARAMGTERLREA